ncbi:hypothetical protein C8T65DRAFT_700579 [Cerioporus squamosus]|nr:hypothetical protein C8T65DRAFT_700579 [Cerioporus squamosus]
MARTAVGNEEDEGGIVVGLGEVGEGGRGASLPGARTRTGSDSDKQAGRVRKHTTKAPSRTPPSSTTLSPSSSRFLLAAMSSAPDDADCRGSLDLPQGIFYRAGSSAVLYHHVDKTCTRTPPPPDSSRAFHPPDDVVELLNVLSYEFSSADEFLLSVAECDRTNGTVVTIKVPIGRDMDSSDAISPDSSDANTRHTPSTIFEAVSFSFSSHDARFLIAQLLVDVMKRSGQCGSAPAMPANVDDDSATSWTESSVEPSIDEEEAAMLKIGFVISEAEAEGDGDGDGEGEGDGDGDRDGEGDGEGEGKRRGTSPSAGALFSAISEGSSEEPSSDKADGRRLAQGFVVGDDHAVEEQSRMRKRRRTHR